MPRTPGEYNPSGSELQSTPSLSKKLLALVATGSFLVTGCATSSAEGNAQFNTQQSSAAEQIDDTSTQPDMQAEDESKNEISTQLDMQAEDKSKNETSTPSYVYEPTREWNLNSLEDLTTNWDTLNDVQREEVVKTFYESNGIENMNAWERNDLKSSADTMRRVYELTIELANNEEIPQVDKAVENLISVITSSDKARREMNERARNILNAKRRLIENGDYEYDPSEIGLRLYNTTGIIKTSSDIVYTTEEKSIFSQAFMTEDNLRTRKITILNIEVNPSKLGKPGDLGFLKIAGVWGPNDFDYFVFSDEDITSEDLWNRPQEKP